MKQVFSIKEFLITRPKNIGVDIADKLFWNHIIPMIPVRNELGLSITASLRSGYRPKWYELAKGRNGSSQHVFKGKGAVDWTCKDFTKNKDELLRLIIKHTEYTRICVYKGFIHCDYKATPANLRRVYEYQNKEWKFIRNAA